MTTRHASLPDGFSDSRLMLVTTVFARTWSDSEVSLGSRGVRATGGPEQARSKPARHQGEDNLTPIPTCMTVSLCHVPPDLSWVSSERSFLRPSPPLKRSQALLLPASLSPRRSC